MGSTARKVSLTGIKPTGEPHLGNYIGAILPALELADSYDSVYFIADHHALTTIRDRDLLRHYTRSVAATWLAAGLDPDRTTFYRQSDIPETFELAWVVSCVTGKGLMNRAHAYKAVRDRNREAGKDDLDAGVNMGLFNYPVLMAVDILLMDADVVPVGRDQLQHVEYAADIAGAFNAVYGEQFAFKIPTPIVPAEGTAHTMPGTDGRKMSKSYGNTIPLFAPEATLRKTIRRIPTDSVPVEAPKDPDSSSVFTLLEHFGTADVVADTRAALLAGGMGWGEVKARLTNALNHQFAPMREKYEALMAPGSELDDLLAHGAEKARKQSQPLLERVREAIGIR
ncbi:tryptophan--tRNA ligase [Pilimelia columellifera]|uniref:Tryptophan--tRNA ligase n=1 Tax=Pilimelia columellifera subsp. columellifera TaxID=706583 RepID=A0ABP6ACB4_9ACTN